MTLRIHISSHNDDLHNTTAKRNLNGGVVGIDNNLMDIKYLPIIFDKLTVANFQVNPGTGTSHYPQYINDGNTASASWMDSVGEYAEITFTQQYEIKEFRIYGDGSMDGNGFFKIQHYTKYGWVDNTIDILTHDDWTWSSWTNLNSIVLTNKVRIVATQIDTYGHNEIPQIEIRG